MFRALRGRVRGDAGFTLIELMVVVMIIAVLIAIAIPSFLGFRKSAQDRAVQSELRSALLADKAFWLENGDYSHFAADLQAFEPNLRAHDTDLTQGVVPWLNTTDSDIVCITGVSESGTTFSVWESATAGTYFGATDLSGSGNCPATPPTGYSQDGW